MVLLASGALAQSTVTVIGAVTPGDCTAFNSTTVIKDAGVTCGSGGGGSPGGPNGSIQYNNTGSFGGYTIAQLTALLNIFTSTTQGMVPMSGGGTANFLRADGTFATPVPAGSVANSQLANMAADTVKCNNTSGSAAPIDCTVTQFQTLMSIPVSVTSPAYGATGNGSTDDTTAFQNAWNAACGASGLGHLRIPATANSYLITKMNGTNCNNVILDGDGDQSLIKINGDDANGNWWDLSGSSNITFRNLKFIDNGSPVRVAFLWACTGTSCATSGILGGLIFDHVNVNAKFVLAGLYGYGYGVIGNAVPASSGALGITNGTWINTNNSGSLVGEETRTSTFMFTAYNAGSVRSVYQTLTTSTAIAAGTYIANVNVVDGSTTGSTKSNNAAMVTDGVNQFTMIGGSVQCICVSDFIGWTSDEAVTFVQTAFEEPIGGTACITTDWLEFGGGVNAAIDLQNVFFSCPGPSGAIIALDQGISAGAGGIWFLTFVGADVGLNTNSDPFIGKTAAGCGTFTAANNWIVQSNLNLVTGANNIVTCGSIDSQTIIQKAGSITIPGGATDHGSANPFR